ncbi:MAG: pyroglutamyl-peptidase I [Candidatus Heimdallarchaeaceae archaeon]
MMKKIVLTGFEPFGGSDINPSILACKEFEGKNIDGYTISVYEIPLRFDDIKSTLESILEQENPQIVICTGQSSRSVISLERVAINIADIARSAYNCGAIPRDAILEETGNEGYFSTLPIRRIFNELEKNKVPTEISNSAGTYGCNQIFYHLMYLLNLKKYKIPAGFVHVPSLPEQAVGKRTPIMSMPSMSLELIVKALKIIIETTINEIEQTAE